MDGLAVTGIINTKGLTDYLVVIILVYLIVIQKAQSHKKEIKFF